MKTVVEKDQIRLDKYLADNTEYSRSLILKMIKDGYILVNKKAEKPSFLVNIGDEIEIKDGYIKEDNINPEEMPLEIVYEDDYLMVINKPSGIVVHPGAGNHSNTLVNALKFYTDSLSDGEDETRPGIVHRIDKDTSGLILVAKTNKCEELLSEMFKKHTINREYIALVRGIIPQDKIKIDAPIGRNINNRKQMTVTAKNSKEAITHLMVLKRYKDYSLIKLKLETGRTHQIRVHMKYIGYPIYNDPVYSNDKASEFGQFLHSYSMSFTHPITNEELSFKVDIPKYFQDFIDTLE